jgi:hypothetical protein
MTIEQCPADNESCFLRKQGELDSLPYIRDAVLSFQGVTTAT